MFEVVIFKNRLNAHAVNGNSSNSRSSSRTLENINECSRSYNKEHAIAAIAAEAILNKLLIINYPLTTPMLLYIETIIIQIPIWISQISILNLQTTAQRGYILHVWSYHVNIKTSLW